MQHTVTREGPEGDRFTVTLLCDGVAFASQLFAADATDDDVAAFVDEHTAAHVEHDHGAG